MSTCMFSGALRLCLICGCLPVAADTPSSEMVSARSISHVEPAPRDSTELDHPEPSFPSRAFRQPSAQPFGSARSGRPIFFALSALSAPSEDTESVAQRCICREGARGARSKKDGGGLLNSDRRNPWRPEKKTKTPPVPKTCLSPPLGNVCIRQDTAESESNPAG